jgi:hypothetical protein
VVGARLGHGILAVRSLLSACAGTRGLEDVPPDLRYGHRFEDVGPMGRITKYLTEPTVRQSTSLYPVHVDSVTVRHGQFVHGLDPDVQRVAADVVLKSAFPKTATNSTRSSSVASGTISRSSFLMRKPRDIVCNRVRVPFRHYVVLDGSFRPGHYTMKINSRVVPFQVRPYR